MEAAYHRFAAGQAGKVRPQSLTYNHIYWASVLDNPLVSVTRPPVLDALETYLVEPVQVVLSTTKLLALMQ